MKKLPLRGRTLALLVTLVPLTLLFIYVALRSGPLAPVAVTIASVERRAISPALFGIGTVDARHTYKIGPIATGRLLRLDVDVGDRVTAGQVLGEMDPVDLDDKLRAQQAAMKQAEAQLQEAQTRQNYARTQARRYEQLHAVRSTSEETYAAKRHEFELADATLKAAQQQVSRVRSDQEGLSAQRKNLKLVAPVDALVSARKADPGTTLVAGQAAVELIDPTTIWVNARFDQLSSRGLATGLAAQVVLRSRAGQALSGHVSRVEPLADAVTEEITAKVGFDKAFATLPPVGELAEITVTLPDLAPAIVVPNASLKRFKNRVGVWQVKGDSLEFTPITTGATDLSGMTQVLGGLESQAQIVVYSERALTTQSRIKIVDRLPGAGQ
ncbi:MAG: efflux RND transporter periplasmic adaptor subunit [Burkholderiaceae bacterium]|nr:efflux RND transporter periplasmic adaptor subunit [Burkholderiaceae bacterium]